MNACGHIAALASIVILHLEVYAKAASATNQELCLPAAIALHSTADAPEAPESYNSHGSVS